MATTSYALALGSNRQHGRHGPPAAVLRAAIAQLGALGTVKAISRIRDTPPLGPSARRYANAGVILSTDLQPQDLLAAVKQLERDFGRRRGVRWGARVLDIDLILWSAGSWSRRGLTLPHPSFRVRRFVLDPLRDIAPDWRDPVTALTIRQLHARALRPRPVDQPAGRT
jgi:2-amino-4-hydroxy-6-hydroxymethyldihydropteridine diphosphokinase